MWRVRSSTKRYIIMFIMFMPSDSNGKVIFAEAQFHSYRMNQLDLIFVSASNSDFMQCKMNFHKSL